MGGMDPTKPVRFRGSHPVGTTIKSIVTHDAEYSKASTAFYLNNESFYIDSSARPCSYVGPCVTVIEEENLTVMRWFVVIRIQGAIA